LRNLSAREILMTSKEKAELLFKQEQLSGGPSSIPEYEQRALAERTKIARLRALRLARDAELASRPEETAEKLKQLKSPKTSRRAREHSPTRRVLRVKVFSNSIRAG
jgi:hypothetical protein